MCWEVCKTGYQSIREGWIQTNSKAFSNSLKVKGSHAFRRIQQQGQSYYSLMLCISRSDDHQLEPAAGPLLPASPVKYKSIKPENGREEGHTDGILRLVYQ